MIKNKVATLNELMGNKEEVSLENLHEHLGANMPQMEFNHVGKARLVQALAQRFGQNYRAIPGVSNTIAEFDKKMKFHSIVNQNRKA